MAKTVCARVCVPVAVAFPVALFATVGCPDRAEPTPADAAPVPGSTAPGVAPHSQSEVPPAAGEREPGAMFGAAIFCNF